MLLCGCQVVRDYLDSANRRAWTAYHESRWQAVLDACVTATQYTVPAQPVAPRQCAAIEQRYRTVAEAWAVRQAQLHTLASQSAVETVYLAQLLDVLETRDRQRLSGLASQLPLHESRLLGFQDTLTESLEEQRRAVKDLQQAWETVWPVATGQQLDFDLAEGVQRTRKNQPAPEEALLRELTEYYRQHYARLAMVYLDYTPGFTPLPAEQCPPPPGCEEIAAALEAYEAGLRVHYDLNTALEADLSRLSDLAGFDPEHEPWAALTLPKKGWQQQRTEAALARLKLLGRANGLLTGCLELQQAWLGETWLRRWPSCPRELNLFEYADWDAAPAPAPVPMAGWRELTFRN